MCVCVCIVSFLYSLYTADLPDLVVVPTTVNTPVFLAFQIECLSNQPDSSPTAQYVNGAGLERDDRFELIRPDNRRLIINAPYGLSKVYNGLSIR